MIEERLQKDYQETGLSFHHKVWNGLLGWIDRRPVQVLFLLLLFALVLGIIKLRIDPPSPEFNWENRWWQTALHVARGEGYIACKPIYFPFCGPANQVTAMREPLPVLIFALIALITNESLLLTAAFGVLVNLAILVAVFFLTRELADTRAGQLAALIWACYLPPVRLFYHQISGDLLASLGITCGLIFFLRAQKTDQGWAWLASGLLFGLAILSRSSVLAVTGTLTLVLLFWPSARPKVSSPRARWFYPALLFTFAWSLVASPWIIRNTIVFGRPVIGSTLAGYYLYRQNHILATDGEFRFVSGGEFLPVLHEMVARRPELTGTENEAQMDRVYRQEAVRVITAHPLRYVALSAYRFPMLWFNWKVNEVYGKVDTFGDHLMAIQHVLLLAVGFVGLYGRFRQAWPLAVSVGASSLLYMAVMAHLPYIVPVVPALVVLSAIALITGGATLVKILKQSAWTTYEE